MKGKESRMETSQEARTQWHKQRKLAVGASESAAILGVDPWSSPLEVWARKTGRIVDDDLEDERMKWGHILEPVILGEFQERIGSGIAVSRHDQTNVVRHRNFPAIPMSCTPDAHGSDGRLIQIKTTSAFNSEAWKDGPPLHVQVQEQHEMAVCERELATVVALIGGQRLKFWDIERNDSFIEMLEEQCSAWWERFVMCDEQPPADDGDTKTIRMLEKLHPDDSGEEVILGDDFIEIDQQLQTIKESMKALRSEQKELENKLKGAIGAATFGILPSGISYSWKTQNRAGYTVADTKFRVLRRFSK